MMDRILAMRLDEVKAQASTHDRVRIRPSVTVRATTPVERETVRQAARKVIAEHRDVLVALKDR